MRRKNSPGCGCCAGPLCVNPAPTCPYSPGGPYVHNWFNQIQFVPDESSPLVSGTPWRSTYHAVWLTAFDIAAFGQTYLLDQPVTLCGLTYDPARKRWKGYTDSPPAESDYPYRLNFEIASDAAMSIDPAGTATPPTYANNCHRRMWISDRHDVQQTDDLALNASSGAATSNGVGNTEQICFGTVAPSGYPCRSGHLIDFEGLIPKFLLNPPGGMKLSIDGLYSPVQGDLSGDYILDGGINFDPDGGGCPVFEPGSPPWGLPIAANPIGIDQRSNACPWAYDRIYAYMPAANPFCSALTNYQQIGLLHLQGFRLRLFYVINYLGYYRIAHQRYALRALSDETGPAYDLFAGDNLFDYEEPESYGGFTDLAGCTFPPTCRISFGSWN